MGAEYHKNDVECVIIMLFLLLTEATLRFPPQHLPIVLILFIVCFTGLVDVAIGVEPRVLVTLLAPLFWLGIYLISSNRRMKEG